jgi:hypothetical protein
MSSVARVSVGTELLDRTPEARIDDFSRPVARRIGTVLPWNRDPAVAAMTPDDPA